MSDHPPKKPVKKFRGRRGISVAVWQNEYEKDGKTIVWYAMTTQKRYCDKNGVWHTAHSIPMDDIPIATLLENEAYAWHTLREDDEREADDQEIVEPESESTPI